MGQCEWLWLHAVLLRCLNGTETNRKPPWPPNLHRSWPTFMKRRGTSTNTQHTHTQVTVNMRQTWSKKRGRLSELRFCNTKNLQMQHAHSLCVRESLLTASGLVLHKLQLKLMEGNIPKLNFHMTISSALGQPVFNFVKGTFQVGRTDLMTKEMGHGLLPHTANVTFWPWIPDTGWAMGARPTQMVPIYKNTCGMVERMFAKVDSL